MPQINKAKIITSTGIPPSIGNGTNKQNPFIHPGDKTKTEVIGSEIALMVANQIGYHNWIKNCGTALTFRSNDKIPEEGTEEVVAEETIMRVEHGSFTQ